MLKKQKNIIFKTLKKDKREIIYEGLKKAKDTATKTISLIEDEKNKFKNFEENKEILKTIEDAKMLLENNENKKMVIISCELSENFYTDGLLIDFIDPDYELELFTFNKNDFKQNETVTMHFRTKHLDIFKKNKNKIYKHVDYVLKKKIKEQEVFSENLENPSRKLASVQKVLELTPIKDADKIELAKVNGWQTIVKKGEFKEGDLGVYFEIDSFLPEKPEFEFLKGSYRQASELNPAGYRLRTMKMRGEISQGLLLNFETLNLNDKNLKEGDDVTELLGVKKWLQKESISSYGVSKGSYSIYTNKTDEERIQSNPTLLNEINGKPYYETLKLDGSSMTVELVNDEFKIYSRNHELARPEGDSDTYKLQSTMWFVAEKLKLEEKLKNYSEKNIILKGELVGPGIQGNPLGLEELDWRCFTIERLNGQKGERVNFDDFVRIAKELGIKTVDILEEGDSFNYTVEDLLEKAKGKYDSGKHREGIVIRPKYPETFRNRDFSFKAINNDFLLKEEK